MEQHDTSTQLDALIRIVARQAAISTLLAASNYLRMHQHSDAADSVLRDFSTLLKNV